LQQTTWPNSCLGIVRRQPCLPGEISGYRLTIDIKGQVYEFHSSTAEPLNLRLATGPAVNINLVAFSSPPAPENAAAEAQPGPLAEAANLVLLEASGVALAGQVACVTDSTGSRPGSRHCL
jgi:hypothetical protein